MNRETSVMPVDRNCTRSFDPTELCEHRLRCSAAPRIRELQRKSGTSVFAEVNVSPSKVDWTEAASSLTSSFGHCLEPWKEDREDAKSISVLREIHALAESNRVRQAASRIMEYTDGLLLESRFDVCGRLLSQIDVERLSIYPTLLVAFLGITLGAKEKLGRTREDFYSRAESALSRELGRIRAERILRRFR